MSSLLNQDPAQHHLSRVRPIPLRDLPLHLWIINRWFLELEGIVWRQSSSAYFGNFGTYSTPVAQSAPRNLLTRWDVSSIPANGIFLTKNKKNKKKKMPNGWRTINSLVHKIRLHGRRGKGKAESFSRQKSRHAPQKEGGLKILCDPGWYVQRT